jgi:hypothetical protein
MVGVWDTVGGLGIPAAIGEIDPLLYGFLDTSLHPDVLNAYHALAIDEKRTEFHPTLWTSQPKLGQTMEQVWFCGAHSDVGGGDSDEVVGKPALSDITLAWMLKKAAALDLQVYPEVQARYSLPLDPAYSMAKLDHAWNPLWGIPSARSIGSDAVLANSVAARCQNDRSYRPENLTFDDGVLWPRYGLVTVVTLPRTEQSAEADEVSTSEDDASNLTRALLPESQRVSSQADNPAIIDQLGRRPFAEVLAARIEEVWRTQDRSRSKSNATTSETEANGDSSQNPSSGFMIHIDGPWGSGKTSVLNFLRGALQSADRPIDRKWVVVEFNAWQQQRIRPPWWTLIREIYGQSMRQLALRSKVQLAVRWWWWCFRADWLPVVATAVVILLCVLVTTGVIGFVPKAAVTASGQGGTQDEWANGVALGIKILSAVLAAGAAVFTFSRTMVFGSARAAQTYTDLRSDPLRPIVRLFVDLVRAIRRPLVVFVDDLDRCDSKYVVELLEGIQTLFRQEPVTYVVAADRKWICSSFEQEFRDYTATIGEPGRPLGYLFLDKVFQVSVSIPRLSPQWQRAYWLGLLQTTTTDDPKALDATRKRAENAATETVQGIHTQEALQQKIQEASDDPVREQAVRVAAAKQITRPEARLRTEHRLQRWAELIEHNPRSMKRVVNALAMQQAIHFLEGREVSPETLAQWTIIELRWPILADFLSANPSAAAYFRDNATLVDGAIPEGIAKLFSAGAAKATVFARGVAGAAVLDEARIRELIA